MITCPITSLPLEHLYKYVYKTIKTKLDDNKVFDIDSFIDDFYKEALAKSDKENAAKWVQSIPRIINMIVNDSFTDKIDNVKGIGNIYKLIGDYSKPGAEGLNNVLTKYNVVINSNDLKEDAAHQLSLNFTTEEEEDTDEDIENKENDSKIIARLKTPVVMSGTLSSFIPVDPSKKTDTYIEKLDVPRAQIVSNLAVLGNALSMDDSFLGDFEYQGEKIKVKATNLYAFSQQHFNELDPTTKTEIKNSSFLVSTGRNQMGVSQTDQRVILVITNGAGENLYFDKTGNITTKENGNLVYQFLRDVRQTSKGYSVTDIYGREEQLMSVDVYAKMTYDENVDGDYPTYLEAVKDDRLKQLEKLFKIKEKA